MHVSLLSSCFCGTITGLSFSRVLALFFKVNKLWLIISIFEHSDKVTTNFAHVTWFWEHYFFLAELKYFHDAAMSSFYSELSPFWIGLPQTEDSTTPHSTQDAVLHIIHTCLLGNWEFLIWNIVLYTINFTMGSLAGISNLDVEL